MLTTYIDQQTDKEQALTRTKWIATSLFVLVTVLYIVSRGLERRYPGLAVVAAFAEAAMVGALADWELSGSDPTPPMKGAPAQPSTTLPAFLRSNNDLFRSCSTHATARA